VTATLTQINYLEVNITFRENDIATAKVPPTLKPVL